MMDLPFADLAEKLLISFKFVKSLYEMDEITIEEVVYEMEKYQQDPIAFMKENIVKINPAIEDSLNEVNKVFLDIIENYKRVHVLKNTLKSISIQALKREQKVEAGLWDEFIIKFRDYDEFLNKCITLKIINSCLSEDLGETLISIQLILLEYIFIRYASYLQFSIIGDVIKSDIKDYVVVFSRIIENNAEAVLDYLYEKYNDEILELDYLSFLSAI